MAKKKTKTGKTGKDKIVRKRTEEPEEIKEPVVQEEVHKDVRKGHGLAARILIKAAKIIFIWLPVTLIALVAVVLIAAKLYLSPDRVENLIVSNFNNLSYGTISLDVKEFSPYGGFDIHDILIRNGPEFGNTKFVEIKRLRVKYGLFSMLIGNIHIDEIGIYKPRIYLTEKDGVWNAAKLMKPGGPEKEEPEEIEEEKGPGPKEINLPISVELLFRFILDDLRAYVDGSSFKTSVEGLTYNMDIWIPPFKHVPLDVSAVTLFERMKMELNPRGEMDIAFASKEAGIKTPLILTWKLVFEGSREKPDFASMFRIGAYNAPVRFKNTHLAPLNFMISYDMIYNPLTDNLSLSHFGIQFHDRKWLFLTGNIRRVTKSQEVDLRMTESEIVLDDLYPYFVSLTGDRKTRFSGIVSLFPLAVNGNPQYLNIDGQVNLKRIFFKSPGAGAEIPLFIFSYSVKKKADDMDIDAGVNMPHLVYTLGREKSGDNGLDVDMGVSAFNNFQNVAISKFNFKFYNPDTKKPALDIAMHGDIGLKPGVSGNISITKFTFLKDPLLGMVTAGIKKSLAGVPLEKPLDLTLGAKFALGSEVRADLALLLKVPDYNINDFKLGLNVIQDNVEKRVTLNRFTMGTRTLGLSVDAAGTIDLKTAPFSDSDLRLVVKLDSPKMKPVYGQWEIAGLLELAAEIKGDMKTGRASGAINIADFNVRNKESKLSVEDMNMIFPFEYFFAAKGPAESRLAVDKSFVIDNQNFKDRENFTIKSVKAKHPARDIQFEYLKDFAATMFFRNNTFELSKLKMYVLDGAIYGRDILFNLADMPYTGSFKNVEYRLILDVTNVDIGKLDNPDPAAKTREAELSLNANFTGTGLDMFIGKGKDRSKELNVKGFVNINKVGKEFANKLLKGLSEEKGKSKLGIAQIAVDNSVSIRGFNYNLDMGLMYASVQFERRAIGFIVTVQDVKFDRIPIQSYLNSVFGRKDEI